MAKKPKSPDEAVSAATPTSEPVAVVAVVSVEYVDTHEGDEPIVALVEPASEQPDLLSSEDRGDPQGHVLAVGGSAVAARLPGSCVNCGQVGFTITLIATDRYQCSQCKHVWTPAEEQAPFRSHLK